MPGGFLLVEMHPTERTECMELLNSKKPLVMRMANSEKPLVKRLANSKNPLVTRLVHSKTRSACEKMFHRGKEKGTRRW